MAPDSQPRPWPGDGAERPVNAPCVEMVTLIRVRHCIGAGVEGNPFREVDDYYTEDGTFFCRKEPA